MKIFFKHLRSQILFIARQLLIQVLAALLCLPPVAYAGGETAQAQAVRSTPSAALEHVRGLGYIHMLGLSSPYSTTAEIETAHREAKNWFSKNPSPWFEPWELNILEAEIGRLGGETQRSAGTLAQREAVYRRMFQRLSILAYIQNDPSWAEPMSLAQRVELVKEVYDQSMFARANEGLDMAKKVLSDPVLRASYYSAMSIPRQLALPAPGPQETWTQKFNRKFNQLMKDVPEIAKVQVRRLLTGRLRLEAVDSEGKTHKLVFKELSPEEILNQAPEKVVLGLNRGYVENLSMQALTFWLAIGYFGGQLKLMKDYAANPIALEQRMEQAMSPVLPVSLLSFFVTRDYLQSKIDVHTMRKQQKLMRFYAENPGMFERSQRPIRKVGRALFSNMGMASLGVGLVVSGLVNDVGSGIISCNKIASPHPMDKRERQKHLAICNQAWSEWNTGEKFFKYAPMLLTAMGTVFLARIIQATLAATPSAANAIKEKWSTWRETRANNAGVQGKAPTAEGGRVVEPKVNINTAETGRVGMRSTNVANKGAKMLKPGGAASGALVRGVAARATFLGLTLRLVGAHPVVQIAIQIGVTTVILELFEMGYMKLMNDLVNPARIGSHVANSQKNVDLVLASLRRQPLAKMESSCTAANYNCIDGTKVQEQLAQFSEWNKKWRQNLLSGVYASQEAWVDYVYKMSNAYRASEEFYRDIVEQIVKQRARGFFSQLTSLNSTGRTALLLKNAYEPYPLFRASPFYGLGDETVQIYLNQKELAQREAFVKKLDELATDLGQQPVSEAVEKQESSVAIQSELQVKITILKDLNNWFTEKVKRGEFYSNQKPHIDKLQKKLASDQLKDSIEAYRDLIAYARFYDGLCLGTQNLKPRPRECIFHEALDVVKSRFAAPIPQFMMSQIIDETQRVKALSIDAGVWNSGQAIIPAQLGSGEKYLAEADFELDQKGIDVWVKPESDGFGRYDNMSQYLLTQMVCGPDVLAGGSVIKESRGYKSEFKPPRIVGAQMNDFCRNLRFANRNLGDNLFRSLPNWDKGGAYVGIVDLLFKEARPEVLANFEGYWNQVKNQFQQTMEKAEALYRERVVNQDFVEAMNLPGTSSITGNSVISGGRALSKGVINSLEEEADFYMSTVLSSVFEKGKIEEGENKWTYERFNQLKSQILIALKTTSKIDPNSLKTASDSYDQMMKMTEEFAVRFKVSTDTMTVEKTPGIALNPAEKEVAAKTIQLLDEVITEAFMYRTIVGAVSQFSPN